MNKKRQYNSGFSLFLGILCFIFYSLIITDSVQATDNIMFNLGRYRAPITNDGLESAIEDVAVPRGCGFYSNGGIGSTFGNWLEQSHSVSRNFLDPDGNTWDYTVISCRQQGAQGVSYVVEMEDGKTYHNYFRYTLPECSVNGQTTSRPFNDEVNPDQITGTADQMFESSHYTNVGLTVKRKVLSWAHAQDNQYLIVDMTLTNTGKGFGPNTPFGEVIQLPEQTINKLLFGFVAMRELDFVGSSEPSSECWIINEGDFTGDSLRLVYAYDGLRRGKAYDTMGDPHTGEDGRLRAYLGQFCAWLHIDKSATDPTDDFHQPRYTGYNQIWNDPGAVWDPWWSEHLYTMTIDSITHDGPLYDYPGVHQVNMDERDYFVPKNIPYYYHYAHTHAGPYDIAPGEDLHVVYAQGCAGLDPDVAEKVGRDWQNGTCTFPGEWPSPLPAPDDLNDRAKDAWVCTIRDSIHKVAARAKWNYEHNFNIPVPPPPPETMTVTGKPDYIDVTWASNPEQDATFEGYRVYRAKGMSDTTDYKLVFDCSKTKGNVTTQFKDTGVLRGSDYYYYVVSYSVAQGPNAYIPGEILESGQYYMEAFSPARLSRSPGKDLEAVRVVPNPYNVSARDIQYAGEPDKIMFLDLPPECTIRIYSENGNLVRVIEHTDGSGDEAWQDGTQYMTTDSGQIVVSGIYVAHIETPSGDSVFRKFVIIR